MKGHGCREVEVPLGSLGPTEVDQKTLQKVPDVQELTGGLRALLLVFFGKPLQKKRLAFGHFPKGGRGVQLESKSFEVVLFSSILTLL